MIQVILASHGPMAEAMLTTAGMLYGSKENVVALALNEDEDVASFRARMEDCLHINTGRQGTVILCDIPGGTPCNIAVSLAEKHQDVVVLAGMNMVMLLEVLLEDAEVNLDDYADYLVESGRADLRRIQPEAEESDDLLDAMMEKDGDDV